MTFVCPASGLPITAKPEWTNIAIGKNYRLDLCIIGSSFIYSRPRGTVTLDVIKRVMTIYEEVMMTADIGNQGYIQIEDYGFLTHATQEAKKYFIQYMNQNTRFRAVVFCNLSTLFNISVKIGNRFNVTSRPIHTAEGYKEAISTALSLAKAYGIDTGPYPLGSPLHLETGSKTFDPIRIDTNPDWTVRTDGFINTSIMIDKRILHSESEGYFDTHDVILVDRKRHEILRSLGDGGKIDYVVVNSSKLTGSNYRTRQLYMKSFKEWHARYPLKLFIFYGANAFVTTAVLLSNPFMPFRLKVVGDLNEALNLIYRMEQQTGDKPEDKPAPDAGVITSYADELISFIGSIHWDREGMRVPLSEIREDHPFLEVFRSLAMVKDELDDLFREREKVRKTQQQLEENQAQAHKLEAIGTLAGGLAHDFNNIMMGLLGNLSLAQDEIPENSNAAALLRDAEKSIARARELTGQLLTFSKGGEPIRQAVTLPDTIKETAQFHLSGSNTRLHITFDEDLWPGNVDKSQISQVVANLSINADQAMPDGGNLWIEASNCRITDETSLFIPSGDWIVLSFTDDGPGIPKGNVKRIFDPYFTTKDSGNGLGLAIVHSILSSHGGHIRTQSEPGKGTCFTVYLPAAQTSSPPLSTGDPVSDLPVSERQLRALVMDDEAVVRDISEKMLTRLGFSVDKVSEGSDAIRCFEDAHKRKESYDIIIMDLTVPGGMGGKEAVTKILDIDPQASVIVASGYSNDRVMANFREYGFKAIAIKPYSMEDLKKAIAQALTPSNTSQEHPSV